MIVDHNVERGNPADAPQLVPAVDRVRTRAGRPPRTATADRGYGEKAIEDDLRDLGVRNVVIPRKGKPSAGRRAEEHRPAFRRTIEWRRGVEGRISAVKRRYGWDRTRIDSTEGDQIWSATVSWRTTRSRSAPRQREGRGSGESVANPIPTGRKQPNHAHRGASFSGEVRTPHHDRAN